MDISRSERATRSLVLALALLLVAALFVVAGPAVPAQAACGDIAFSRAYNGVVVGSYRMGLSAQKQNVGCFDGNVRESSHSTWHRGQWFSDAGVWQWSSAGPKFISAGTQSPVIVLIEGPISVGRWLRIGTLNQNNGTGIWWF